ncbi:hypothetical protein [Limosilactobacillus fermentum]|nr:hypothetical protein [Limosilactobacillus fermentum]MCD5422937.1 hypothetical protein [Limosilactobacillus fermentum]
MMKETNMIRPKDYLDKRDHDLFWHFEHGYYPAVVARPFAVPNDIYCR